MKLDIKTVAPNKLDDLLNFDPLSIVSLMVLPSGAVIVVSLTPMEVNKEVVIMLPDMENDAYPNIYRIFGINICSGYRSIDSIGFNDKVSATAKVIGERMKRDGITNALFPAFLKNEGASQPWGAATSFFEGIDGDMPRFLRGGHARVIDGEYLIFAYGKELMRSKISSFKKKNWDFIPIADFPADITFIGRPNGLVVPITLSNGDVYKLNIISFLDEKVEKNVRAWVGKTKHGMAFFRGKELVLRPLVSA